MAPDPLGHKWRAPPSDSIIVVERLDDEPQLEYVFDTRWSPPTEWVRLLSAIFPTLGVALHAAEPGVGFYGSETYRGGVRIRQIDYDHDLAEQIAFSRLHFKWDLSVYIEDERSSGHGEGEEPSAERNSEIQKPLVVTEQALEGVTEHVIDQIAQATRYSRLRQLHGKLVSLGLTEASAYVLIARHAQSLPDPILQEVLEHPIAVIALALRQSCPKRIAAAAYRATLDRLMTEPVPKRPALPEDSLATTLGEELKDLVSLLTHGVRDAGKMRDSEDAAAYRDWLQKIQAWRRLVTTCIRLHGFRLSRTQYQAAYRRIQELTSDAEPATTLRNALIEALACSDSTPGYILEAICPQQSSALMSLIASHPRLGVRLCVRLLNSSVDTHARVCIAMNSRLANRPEVFRAMLQPKLWLGQSNSQYSHELPLIFSILAQHVPISYFPTFINEIANWKMDQSLEVLLAILETLPPERKALIPNNVITSLLQSEERWIRQRALLLLGDFTHKPASELAEVEVQGPENHRVRT